MHDSAEQAYRVAAQAPAARRGKCATAAKSIALAVVLGVHVLGVALFWTMREANDRERRDESVSVLLLLPLTTQQAANTEASPDRTPPRRRKSQSKRDASVQAPAIAPVETSAPVGIDWANEARLAAVRQIERDTRATQSARRFQPRKGHSLAAQVPQAHEFGWSHASTHRVEVIAGGGIVFNINDRCAVLVMLIPIPTCTLGKIEPRGDLFLHMDAPVPLPEESGETP